MTDRTHPDSGRATGAAHIIRYALELGLLWIDGDGRDKVREALDALDALEAQLEAIGAGGVQALSAAPEIHEPKCPALDGAGCTCAKHDPTIDRAWAQFCGGIGDGLDAPYPGMISAFERYYSQSFADKAWRKEASVWAAAWKAALLAASPTPPAEPEVGNSGFDYKTAADFLNGKTVSDEAVRKFVAASRWAHDERTALSATLLAMHGVLTSREAEIALLKKALLEADTAPQPAPAPLSECLRLLNSFEYEGDEDSQAKAFFKAHINEDWFFHVKNSLELALAAQGGKA